MIRQALHRRSLGFMTTLFVAGFLALPAASAAQVKPPFKPGFNFYKPAQDIEIGKQGAAEVEKELRLVKDPAVQNYVSQIGHRLVEFAPGYKEYPWTFKVVDSQDINAFALPGGFIYINRGILEAADNEAQVAGVIAHEIGHVVMRHGTHRASQAQLGQGTLGILGGILGGGSAAGQAAQIGAGFLTTSILLKNSRGAESQSDDIGTYMLYDAGYDPRAMAEFFDIIGKKYPQRTAQFFSDHPNPENRVKRVNKLISTLGPARQTRNDNSEFLAVKSRVMGMPAPSKVQPGAQPAATPAPSASVGTPAPPSSRRVQFQGEGFSIAHPENWQTLKGQNSVTIAPAGGVFTGSDGEWAQAYGASIMRGAPRQSQTLEAVTGDLIKSWQRSNPAMRVLQQKKGKVRGRPALSTEIENDSPLAGQKEKLILVSVDDPNGVLAVIFVAPVSDYKKYQPTFSAMLKSLEFQ